MNSDALQIRLLGPVDATVGGVSRPIAGLRRKAILAALSLHPGEAIGTDRLIDIVWGDSPPAKVLNTLQSNISYLRNALGNAAVIIARAPGYVLEVPPEATDAGVAEALIRGQGKASDPAAAATQLQQALSLWRGRTMADLIELRWFQEQSERLENIRLDATQALIDARLALGEHEGLVPELETLVEQHPFREHFHLQLMLSLYRAGRQADALEVYRRLRARLLEDLGIDPSPPLRDLEAAILRQDQHLREFRLPLSVIEAHPRPAQLPLAVPTFSARQAELAELDSLLGAADAGNVGIAAIWGTAGVGKTALAVHWAHRVAAIFPDGQLYLNMRGFHPSGSITDPSEGVRGFLGALGCPAERIPAGLDAQASLYRSLLSGKRVLIVLDNARDTEQIRPLLPGSAGCLAVVTSRNKLTGLVAAEGAHPISLELPAEADAQDMLARRLGLPRLAAEPGAVEDIIASCARLPLALAITAARAAASKSLPLSALAAQLRNAASALDPFHDADAATDVRAVFSWSYQSLSPDAATLFRQLGWCRGDDIAASTAASAAGLPIGEVYPLLAELARGHLLGEQQSGRYSIHDLLRAYALEQSTLHDSGQWRAAVQARLTDHYLHSAHGAAMLLGPARRPVELSAPQPGVTLEPLTDRDQALAWFTAELPALLAIGAKEDSGAPKWTWQFAWCLLGFLELRGYWQENAAIHKSALDQAELDGDKYGQAYCHRSLGGILGRLGQLDDAYEHTMLALELFESLGDQTTWAFNQLNLAWISGLQQLLPTALKHGKLALQAFESAEHLGGQAKALNSTGWNLAQLGYTEEGRANCQRALSIAIEIGDVATQCDANDSLGFIYEQLRQPSLAIECYQHAVSGYQQLGDRYAEAAALSSLGDVFERTGNQVAAQQVWQQALAIFGQLRHPDAVELRSKLEAAAACRAASQS